MALFLLSCNPIKGASMAKVLVTDDSKFLRNRICKILDSDKHKILEASNGLECMQIIASESPDVIFLDLVMPEMDGFEVLESIRNQHINIPVIVLTADIQDGITERCMELGAIAYLNKPPKQDELLAALEYALIG